MPSQYCPHHATCPFYKNWTEKTGDKRTDVIFYGSSKSQGLRHDCLTLTAIDGSDAGVGVGDELRVTVPKDDTMEGIDCSHLISLNNQREILAKLVSLERRIAFI